MSRRCFAVALAAAVVGRHVTAGEDMEAAHLFHNETDDGFALENATDEMQLEGMQQEEINMENVSLLGVEAATSRVSSLDVTWEDCGSKGFWPSMATITGFEPRRLPLGRKTTLRGWGTLAAAVQGGTVHTTTRAGFLKTSSDGDLCVSEESKLPMGAGGMTRHGVTCPATAGRVEIAADIELAQFLPRMLLHTTVTITGTASTGAPIFCLKMKTSPARRLATEDDDKDDSTPGFLV